MAQITRRIGLSLGADICWPICYEGLLRQLDPKIPSGDDTLSFEVERVHIEPFDLMQGCKYDVVIDRLTHWYHTSREWIKKAIAMNDLYVFNNPWSLQSMEKHTTYCAMMRLGLPVPDTWMIPPKSYAESSDLQPTLKSYARMFNLGDIGDRIGYPLFIKPYDGGAWVGVTAIKDRDALLEAYNDSGTRVMHLQKGVVPFEGFVRCVGLGPQWRCVNYDPDAPLHDRYRMDTDFLPAGGRAAPYRHHDGDQRVFRLGFQFLRITVERWRLVPHRFRQCLPGFAGDIAALSLSLADQGKPALVIVLRRHRATHEYRPELARLF